MYRILFLLLFLLSTPAQAVLVIDDFSGPGFHLCVNQSGCPTELDFIVGQAGGQWNNRDADLNIQNRSDPFGDPDTPGDLTEAAGVLSLSVPATNLPVDPIDEDRFTMFYFPPTATDFTADGDAFLIDLLASDLGARTVFLTVDVIGSSGAGGTATIPISAAGTYAIPFSSLTGTFPEIGLQLVVQTDFFVDFDNALGASPINLTFDNFRVANNISVVPLPGAVWLFISGLILLSRRIAPG